MKCIFSLPISTLNGGPKISYFGNNDLLLPQFRPGSNYNKNRSGRLRDSKKN